MRQQVFSDLHSDALPPRPSVVPPNVDAVIVAGDIRKGAEEAFRRLRQTIPMQVPILTTMGNHEYYRRHLGAEQGAARQLAHNPALMVEVGT